MFNFFLPLPACLPACLLCIYPFPIAKHDGYKSIYEKSRKFPQNYPILCECRLGFLLLCHFVVAATTFAVAAVDARHIGGNKISMIHWKTLRLSEHKLHLSFLLEYLRLIFHFHSNFRSWCCCRRRRRRHSSAMR